MFRRRPRPARVGLRPLTLGRYLAARAVLLEGAALPEVDGTPVYVNIEPDTRTAGASSLLSMLDLILSEPPERFTDEEALRETARVVWEDVEGQAGRANQSAFGRASFVETYTGHYLASGPEGERLPPPLEYLVGSIEATEYAAIRDLPLWEALLVLRCRAVILGKREAERRESDG